MRKRGYKSKFINGKQKRIKREPKIDGMDEEELLRRTQMQFGWFRTKCTN
jgi:hypothetical protein